MVPLLSRIHDDKARFRDIYVRTNWMLAAVTMPGIAALTLTSDQIVGLLFGAGWAPVAPIFAWLGIASLVQSVSSTTGWIFICQGKTKTMFHWGIYSSLTTVAAFLVGLHWGAVGVAAAYAISGYVLRVPVLAVLVHRVGPVTATDFLLMQGLFIASSVLAWFLYLWLPASLTGQSDLLAVFLALALNYGIGLVFMLAVPQSRRALFTTLSNAARNIR
jgi:O-antigen/teichoic acid export membrane protein